MKRLENWAFAVEPLFLALPPDWRAELTARYQERVAELSQAKQPSEEVVWEEDEWPAKTISHRELMAQSTKPLHDRPRTVVPAPKRRLEQPLDHTDRGGIPGFLRRGGSAATPFGEE